MCTLVIQRCPGQAWPILIAANREEMRSRRSLPPARHWPDRMHMVAGLDVEAGGSWLGINDHGLVAAIMNRHGSLGPAVGKRSRGELVLEALDHAEAGAAAGALADLNPAAYRPFNLLVADPRDAYWVRYGEDGTIRVHPIAPGLHMLGAGELDERSDPRIAAYLPRFAEAPVPDPERGDWTAWRDLLGSPDQPAGAGPQIAMTVEQPDGFGTLSSALIAIPAYPGYGSRPIWLHAEGRPDRTDFVPVSIAS